MKHRLTTMLPGLFLLHASLFSGSDIPSRPEQLEFPSLQFSVPDADAIRFELANGIPVYIIEDRQLPLVGIQLFFRGGKYMEPTGKEGLAELAGRVWRTGGAADRDAASLDEELDFLAARLSTSLGLVNGSVSLNLLSKDLDRGLELFMDVLLLPRFDEDRFEQARDALLASMKQRNDDGASIEGREWQRLLYGDGYWLNRLPTQASVESLSREDLREFHADLLHPDDLILAVAGDFSRESMIAKLESTIGTLSNRGSKVPDVPQPNARTEPAVYLVNKPDVNQGRVSIGHLGLVRPVEEEFSLMVADDILGGGGFTSWILSRVRSDEGLAYSAGSSYGINNTFPGTFRAFFQSKSSTCARAAQIIVEAIGQLRREGIAEQELITSKNSFIQTFPNRFQSAMQTAVLFALDELVGRPHDYWLEYRDEVAGTTLESVKASAQKYIRPDDLVFLVVGNIEEILKGHPDFPSARFEDFGRLVRLPLRDPMTLEPLQ